MQLWQSRACNSGQKGLCLFYASFTLNAVVYITYAITIRIGRRNMQPETPYAQDPSQQPQQTAQPYPPQQPPQMDMPPAAQYAAPAPAAEDPGKLMSLIGIILPIIGLPFAIVGMQKSKAAGYDGKLGRVGILVNVMSSIGILLVFLLPFIFVTIASNDLGNTSALDDSNSSQDNGSSKTDNTASSHGLRKGMSKADADKALGMTGKCDKSDVTKATTCIYGDYEYIVTFSSSGGLSNAWDKDNNMIVK